MRCKDARWRWWVNEDDDGKGGDGRAKIAYLSLSWLARVANGTVVDAANEAAMKFRRCMGRWSVVTFTRSNEMMARRSMT